MNNNNYLVRRVNFEFKMIDKIVCIIVLINSFIFTTESLEPYRFFGEGPCSRIRSEPLLNLNRQFLDSLRYVQGGNRYNIYRQSSPYFQYDSLEEEDLLREFCFARNITTQSESSVGTVYGFGRVLNTFQIRVPANDQTGIYFEATPRDALESWDVAKQYITLTDNKSFAFQLTCWTGSNQAGWALLTKTPYADQYVRGLAMDKASHMGFDSRHFLVLRHEDCGREDQQRNNLRLQAGDTNNFLRRRPTPTDTRIGVPFQSSYYSASLPSSPGRWPSRPGYDYNNDNYGTWQQMRYRQQNRYL